MKEMTLISQEMGHLLKDNKIHIPKMFLSMFAQFPIFISIFVATRDVSPAVTGVLPAFQAFADCRVLPGRLLLAICVPAAVRCMC